MDHLYNGKVKVNKIFFYTTRCIQRLASQMACKGKRIFTVMLQTRKGKVFRGVKHGVIFFKPLNKGAIVAGNARIYKRRQIAANRHAAVHFVAK